MMGLNEIKRANEDLERELRRKVALHSITRHLAKAVKELLVCSECDNSINGPCIKAYREWEDAKNA